MIAKMNSDNVNTNSFLSIFLIIDDLLPVIDALCVGVSHGAPFSNI